MLLHAARSTRPDIAFITGQLSRHLEAPQPQHYKAIVRVLRYLKGTMDVGITYRRDARSTSANTLSAYSDAS
jgi:hypothetical protein